MKLRSRAKPTAGRLRKKAAQTFAQWKDSVPDRPTRPHRLQGERLVPVRNTASAKNGKARAVFVKSMGESQGLRLGKLDRRSKIGKRYQTRVQELTQHLGGPSELTAPLATFVDQASRLYLLRLAAWSEIERLGAFNKGELRPAVDAYRRIAADEREVLRTLGLHRAVKPVPSLDEYLRDKSQPRRLSLRTLEAEDGK